VLEVLSPVFHSRLYPLAAVGDFLNNNPLSVSGRGHQKQNGQND